MVTLADLRFYCNDQPRVYPPPNVSAEMIGQGDGSTTQFFLTYPNVQLSSLALSFGTLVTQGQEQVQQLVGQSPSSYSLLGQMVTLAAPAAVGTTVFARYTATAFSDIDLRGILNRAINTYTGMGDGVVLKAAYYDILDVLVIDIDRLRMVRYGEYMTDAKHLVQTLDALKTNIRIDLEGGVRPGRSIPALAQTRGSYRSFNGRR